MSLLRREMYWKLTELTEDADGFGTAVFAVHRITWPPGERNVQAIERGLDSDNAPQLDFDGSGTLTMRVTPEEVHMLRLECESGNPPMRGAGIIVETGRVFW